MSQELKNSINAARALGLSTDDDIENFILNSRSRYLQGQSITSNNLRNRPPQRHAGNNASFFSLDNNTPSEETKTIDPSNPLRKVSRHQRSNAISLQPHEIDDFLAHSHNNTPM